MRQVMIKLPIALALSLATLQGQAAREQTSPKAAPVKSAVLAPLYRIVFKPSDPVPGIGAMPAIRLPFECAGDGTVFISMVQALGTGSPPRNLSPYSPSLLLTSISPSREAHSFPLDQVPDLYDLQEVGDYASESRVIFLVRATREDKQVKQNYTASDGTQREFNGNFAEHHFYIVMFDRQGNYQKTVQIEGGIRMTRLGLFPSGTFLAYGYDEADHAPKLAMLKDDGTLLKFLEIPKGDVPESALGTKDANGKGPAMYVAPVQLAGQGHFIYVVQNKTEFPMLEVNEAGAIRAIQPKLPEGVQINMLVPSDENLYARVTEIKDGSIYELTPQDGAILRRFQVGDKESGADVACVHDEKFLSFQHSDGKLVPLIGTAEPATDAVSADQQKRKTTEPASLKADQQ